MDSDDKVLAIFRELVGDDAGRLKGDYSPADSIDRITSALVDGKKEESEWIRAGEIGFHLLDWQSEAAFLVAVALYPDRFTDEEIREGVEGFLIHAPHHILEAARQGGYETKNIFKDEEKD